MDDHKWATRTQKTWDLHGRINDKINQNGFSFCSHCSNHGRYCVVAESSFEERKKMIAIRDSLKHVHNILIFLQRVKSSQNKQRDEAIAHLEESRKILIERINEYPEKDQRKVDVLEELITFVGDGKTEFPWNFKWKMDENIKQKNVNVNGISNFVVHTIRFGLEFVVIFASIYTSVKLCKSRQQNNRLQREDLLEDISSKESFILVSIKFIGKQSDFMHGTPHHE
ncbi:hypothetical protein DH2020_006155 [Rehmannia glutinosa]|uniref:Uncharacterized protein n=1 Tax=Rehmannia glutinosa TaxID=99300 RepID=A0ABR0XI73_REHGL